jgi:hypothetical protein
VLQPPLGSDPTSPAVLLFDREMDTTTPLPRDLVRVTPAAPGTVAWLNDRALAFTPVGRLPRATRFTLSVADRLRSREGDRLGRTVGMSFSTARPRLASSVPADQAREVGDAPELTLRFDQPVVSRSVPPHLRLVAAGVAAVPLVLVPGPATATEVTFRATRPLRPSTRYQLRLEPGVQGAEGPLPGLEPGEITFTTSGPLRLWAVRCEVDPCRPDRAVWLSVEGSSPLQEACGRVVVEPDPGPVRCTAHDRELRVEAPFAEGIRYGFHLRPEGAAEVEERLHLRFHRRERPPPGGFSRSLVTLPSAEPRLRLTPGPAGWRLQLWPIQPGALPAALAAIAEAGAAPPVTLAEPRPPIEAAVPAGGLDLRSVPGLPSGGTFLAVARPASTLPEPVRRVALVQVTPLHLVARHGATGGVAWVTRATAATATRATLTILDAQGRLRWRGHTDPGGLGRLPGRRRMGGAGPHVLIAQSGADRVVLLLDDPLDPSARPTPGWPDPEPPPLEHLTGVVLPDRPRYAPGEAIHLLGFARARTRVPRGTIGHLPSTLTTLRCRVRSESLADLGETRVPLGPGGTFALPLAVQHPLAPGRYTVSCFPEASWRPTHQASGTLDAAFTVEPTRRGFELALTAPGAPRLDAPVRLRLVLTEASGQVVSNAAVDWTVHRRGLSLRVPTDEFAFGPITGPDPGGERRDRSGRASAEALWVASGEGRTDARGQLDLRVPPTLAPGLDAASLEVSATVTLGDGRTGDRWRSVVVHRHATHLGVALDRQVIEAGQPLAVRVLAVDAVGAPQGFDEAVVRVRALDPARPGSPGDAPSCRVRLSGATEACAVHLTRPGWYRLRVEPAGAEAAARPAEADVLVIDRDAAGPAPRALRVLPVFPEVSEHEPVRFVVSSPVAPAQALVTLERDGVADARLVDLTGPYTWLSLPVGAGLAPRATLAVTVVEPRAGDPAGPATRTATAGLTLRADDELRVDLGVVSARAEPGTAIPVHLRIRSRDGAPTSAAVLVRLAPPGVPRARLAVAPGAGGRRVPPRVATWTTGATDPLPDPELEPEPSPASPGPEDGDPAPLRPGAGVVLGPLLTDERGELDLPLPVPVEPGRYRLEVLAVDRSVAYRFGRASLGLRVRSELGLALAPPAGLRQGDHAVVAVTLVNATLRPRAVTLHARAAGATVSPVLAERVLGPGERHLAHLRLLATEPGVARLQVAAVSEETTAAVERTITVEPAVEPRRVARSAAFSGAIALPVSFDPPPRDGAAASATVSVTVSNTALAPLAAWLHRLALRDAPTLSSAVVRLLALSLITAHRSATWAAPLVDPALLGPLGEAALAQLQSLRLQPGRYRQFPGGPPAPEPEAGAVLLAMHLAQVAGLPVPAETLAELREALRSLASAAAVSVPHRATAIQALQAAGEYVAPAWLDAVLAQRWVLSEEDLARLLPAALVLRPAKGQRLLAELLLRRGALALGLLGPLSTSGREPPLVSGFLLVSLLGQEASAWGVAQLLTALHGDAPAPAIRSARLVPWLLQALDRLERARRPRLPGGTVRVWLDDRPVGQGHLAAGQEDAVRFTLGAEHLGGGSGVLTVEHQGPGPVYYHLRLEDPAPAPAGSGPETPAHLTVTYGAPDAPGGPRRPDTARRATLGETLPGWITVTTALPLPTALLQVPLPAGVEVADLGIDDGPERSGPPVGRLRRLPVWNAVARSGALWLHVKPLRPGIYQHRFVVHAATAGRYHCTEARLRSIDGGRAWASAPGCPPFRISVAEEPSPRPARAP